MTYKQIMALEGRELDKAVAVHVMGVPAYSVDWAMSHDGYVRDYSTDIAAAWQVVEHMPWSVALTNVVDGEWECTVICYDGGETHYDDETVTAPTAPEAICKAALLAHFTDVRGAKNGGGAS